MDEKSKYTIDSSFVIGFLMPDEGMDQDEFYVEQAVEDKIHLIAPFLLEYEVANALRSAVIRKRITKDLAINLQIMYGNLPIMYKEVDIYQILALSLINNISVYDASYLWLAQTQNAPLLTLDESLEQLCR